MMKALLPDRFWALLDCSPDGCWLWRGNVDGQGYGRWGAALVHRLVYEAFVGPVPHGLELDHVCRVRLCARPEPSHLEPVTHALNVARSHVGAINRERLLARTACKRGHPFNAQNTGQDHRGHRYCRTCTRSLHRRYYAADVERSRALGRAKMRARRAREREISRV